MRAHNSVVRGFCVVVAVSLLGAASAQNKTCTLFDEGQGALMSSRAAPSTKGVFEELDQTELEAVRDFLLADPEMNLKVGDDAAANDNYIYMIEMLPPPKLAVLKHLDEGGPQPQRRAYAVLFMMNTSNPRILQVEVGPLPSPSAWKELVYPKQLSPINIHSRPASGPEYAVVETLIQAALVPLADMLTVVLGGWTYSIEALNYTCEDKCMWWTDSAPRGMVNTQRKFWIWFLRLVEGTYLHPVGLEMYMDVTGNDPDKWSVDKISFAGRVWDSPEDLAAFYTANPGKDVTSCVTPKKGLNAGTTAYEFNGIKFWAPGPEDLAYSNFRVRDVSKARPANKRRGPVEYEPQGKRYNITGYHVSYMGWELDAGIRTTAGTRFWDVRFKGKRIAYEIALQSAYASYGGPTSVQAATVYLDNAWGMGASHHELVHGMDCPLHSSYLDFYHFMDAATVDPLKRSMCVFEHNMAMPLRRHYDKDFEGSYRFYAGVPTHALVLRSVSTVFNYDYTFDLILYTDGTLEWKQFSLGYPQAARYSSRGDDQFGYKMFYDVGGTVHDHMLHIKVDLDILGTKNSLAVDEVKVNKVKFAWDPLWPETYTKSIQRSVIETEKAARFKLSAAVYKSFYVINEGKTNKWGAPRAYSLSVPKYIYNLVPDDCPYMGAVSWSKYQIVATRQKDNEYFSASLFEDASPANPVLDFERYSEDDEKLRNKDLVLWVTLGNHHIPLAEDAPNTGSAGKANSFILSPYNFYDEDPATDLIETVILTPADGMGNSAQVDYGMSGVPEDGDCEPAFPDIPFNGTYG